jgi:deoxyribonuclease V
MGAAMPLHEWTLSPEEATQVQLRLRSQLSLSWEDGPIESVAGVDVGIHEETARAAIVVLRWRDLALLESAQAELPVTFPYIPGLLSFREGPVILAAWEKLGVQPDLVMFDGQGIAHPRGIGIAAQMGLWLDLPSIGVGKSRLYGRFQPPGEERGSQSPLWDEKQPWVQIGAVLRTRPGTNPLFVSVGHKMDIAHAVEFVLRACVDYRLPETTRMAHRAAAGKALFGMETLR